MSFAPTAVPAAPRIAGRDFALAAAIGALCILGLALRLVCSNGPLWNNEIWSLLNLAPVTHFWGILWGISHDNNHFLNSLWLFFASSINDDPRWLRAPSILAGACAIPVMAHLGARRSPEAAVVSAALAAFSFFQITYSVEARGYATATLALVIAYAALEHAIDGAPRARWALAAAAGLGFFSHLAMAPAIALLGLVGFAEMLRRGRGLSASVAETARIFWPTALAMLPTAGFVIAGYLHQGAFTIGYFRPYFGANAIGAMVNLEMTTFGLDPASRALDAFARLAAPVFILAAIALAARPERQIAYIVFLVGLPAAVLIAHPPNTHVARYYFAASPFLLLLAAESFCALWNIGGWRRVAALTALAGSLAADASAIARMQDGKSAPWTEALATIANSGDPRLASSFDFNVGKSVAWFNRTRGTQLDLEPVAGLCEGKPTWYIREIPGDIAPYPTQILGGAACRLTYALSGVYDAHIPSQSPWALYRLKDGAVR